MQQADIRIISGKGGVGKTVGSTALALAAAQSGKRVLVCEIHGGDKVAQLLGVEPVGYKLREVFENLWVVNINPRDALHEYVLLVLKFEALYKTLFDNRLVRSFLNLVPALGELVMLGKVWFHAAEHMHDRRRFDLVVVDAPATGHAVALCSSPQAVYSSVPPGPMRDNAALLRGMLENHDQTRLHVVTTAEDMPVTEALTLRAEGERLRIRQGTVLINGRLSPLPINAITALTPWAADPACAPLVRALQRREGRRQVGEEELARLGPRVLQTAINLPRIARAPFDGKAVEELAQLLKRPWNEGLL